MDNPVIWNNTAENDPDTGFTADQSQAMASELIARGVPADQVAAALRADGMEPTAPAVDARTDDQREFDAAFAAPESADAYRINFAGLIRHDGDQGGQAEFNTAATNWLAATGFPELVGPAVIERAIAVGREVNSMGEGQRELWRRSQAVEFERMAGGESQAAEMICHIAQVLARAPRGFTEALRNAGALDEAGVMLHLAHQGERLAERG